MIGFQPLRRVSEGFSVYTLQMGYEAGFSNYMSQGNVCHGGLGKGWDGVGKRFLVEEMSVVFMLTVEEMSSGERVFQVCV